jgi:adenylate kinase
LFPYAGISVTGNFNSVSTLNCGELIIRKDDTPETVKTRLSVYKSQTEPLIDYYTKQGKIVVIDGNAEIDVVKSAVREALKI